MDKWTIMDAFKSLDEKLEEKKMLKESISVHESLDLDEAQNEWLHQRGVVANGDDIDSIGEITGIEDLGNNFDSTVFDFTLDDGKVLTLNGKDIKLNLQEKMPKDLAKAYAHFQRRILSDGSVVGLYDPKSPHAPNDFDGSWRYRNKSRKLPRTSSAVRDWENSTYTEISKKEALKLPTSEKHKLRVIVNSDSDYPKLFMWDVNGKCVTETQHSEMSGNFKDIIEAADKIYLADEPFIQKRIDNDNRSLTADEMKDQNLSLSADGEDIYKNTLVNKAANALAASGSKKYYRDYPDTGAHDMDRQIGGKYKIYQRCLRDYKELISKIKHANSLSAEQLAKLNVDLEDSKHNVNFWYDCWLGYKGTLARQRAVNVKPILMNLDLARLICYKKLLTDAKQKGDDIYNDKFSSEYRDMVNRREELIGKIAEMQKELKGLESALPDAKKQYEELVETKLEGILTECEGYAAALKDLRVKHGLVKESLDDDCVYRIYTEKDGAEDFIDDVPANRDDAVKYAESLYGEYDVVTLCSLCGGDVEIVCSSTDLEEDISKPTLGEIVDARLGEDDVQKESLTEGKKFNIRDDKDLENAKIYKKIGEETNDDLVVIDPSVESEDEENAPKLGKAILQCKACKTSKFEDVDKLVKSEEDENIYNVDDTCPHCGANVGYYYIGQVGKKHDAETPADDAAGNDVGEAETPNAEEVKSGGDDNPEEVALEPVDDDFSDLDAVDDVKEESFQKLVNSYATKLYENVKEYRVTGISEPLRKHYIVEGVLVGNNGKEIATNFELKVVKNARDSILFEGVNKLLTPAENAFKFAGKLENNTLIFESMDYKYEKDNLLIEGVEKN